MDKSPDAFRTISEVAEWLGVQTHVLRFWESKFTQVKPVKRAGGRRYYRPSDMLLLGGIRKLLHEDGLTIKGVQKVLREQGVGAVSELSHGLDDDGTRAPATSAKVVRLAQSAPPREPEIPPEVAADPAPEPADAPAPVAASPEPEAQKPPAEPATESESAGPLPSAAETPESPAAQPELDLGTPEPAFRRRLTLGMGASEPAAPPADTAPEPAASEPPAREASDGAPDNAVEPAPAPAARRPAIVDAPDPPADLRAASRPGLLALLADAAPLDGTTADEIHPLAARLARLMDQMRAAHKE
ncbi:MAG: MerR family transcriptional regulator [Rhodobacteraceae bacterium]|nr:MerR family transcriptional regulator [Paracoccaceae bacterium]